MAKRPPTDINPKQDKKYQPKAYLKYSSLAFQMLGTIAASVWLGLWLDDYLNFSIPVFTIVLVIGGVIAIIYRLYKEVTQ